MIQKRKPLDVVQMPCQALLEIRATQGQNRIQKTNALSQAFDPAAVGEPRESRWSLFPWQHTRSLWRRRQQKPSISSRRRIRCLARSNSASRRIRKMGSRAVDKESGVRLTGQCLPNVIEFNNQICQNSFEMLAIFDWKSVEVAQDLAKFDQTS